MSYYNISFYENSTIRSRSISASSNIVELSLLKKPFQVYQSSNRWRYTLRPQFLSFALFLRRSWGESRPPVVTPGEFLNLLVLHQNPQCLPSLQKREKKMCNFVMSKSCENLHFLALARLYLSLPFAVSFRKWQLPR